MDGGVPSSQPFCPTPKDGNKVSVDRSALVSPKDSFDNYVVEHASAAVYGLTVGEFAGETIECFEDPIAVTESNRGNPAHSVADYSSHANSRQKTIAKRLKILAIARGCLYSPIA